MSRRLLVLSDLHLGRDCNTITGFADDVRPSQDFDQAFVDLLRRYTAGVEDQWRLIFAGDFIDFVEVVVVPEEAGPNQLSLSFEVSKEERKYGLGTEAERAVVKLERTLSYHQVFFEALAGFVRAGGELVIMRGNHDAEMYWTKVQRVLRRALADLAFPRSNGDIDDFLRARSEFQARVSFCPWFYVEPGRIYVEHGHQYDPYCAFDSQLVPTSPSNPQRIDMPLFMFAMRYCVNLMTDFGHHEVQKWSARDYVAWIRRSGIGPFVYAARMAVGAAGRAVVHAARLAGDRGGVDAVEHQTRLEAEARRQNVDPEALSQVDALRHTPITRNLPELLRLLYMDRILLGLTAVLLSLLVVVAIEAPLLQVAALVAVGFVTYRVNKAMEPRRFLLPAPKQIQAAAEIARIMDVPLVVMGHSHIRGVVDLGEGKSYVNTGCWLPPHPGQDHVDPEAPCTCKLSHLVVDDRPELRIFCKVNSSIRTADLQTLPSVWEVTEEHDVLVAP
jgi:UDP-2,3-diacylglucosamine pyrophosphatase LpxH